MSTKFAKIGWVTLAYVVGLILFALTIFVLRLVAPEIYPPLASTPIVSTTQASPITNTITYADALQTYEKIAASAIGSSDRALSSMQWLIGAIIGLVAVAAAAAAYIYKTSRDAVEKAKTAEIAAQSAQVAAQKAEQELNALSEKYVHLSDDFQSMVKQYLDLSGKTMSLDAAIRDRGQGEILESKYIESLQMHSWRKWKDGNPLGLAELEASASDPDGLVTTVKTAIDVDLKILRGKATKTGNLSQEEHEIVQRLEKLLSS